MPGVSAWASLLWYESDGLNFDDTGEPTGIPTEFSQPVRKLTNIVFPTWVSLLQWCESSDGLKEIDSRLPVNLALTSAVPKIPIPTGRRRSWRGTWSRKLSGALKPGPWVFYRIYTSSTACGLVVENDSVFNLKAMMAIASDTVRVRASRLHVPCGDLSCRTASWCRLTRLSLE